MPTLAVELAPVRVNAVSPGIIDTSWWDGLPEEQRAGLFQAVAAASPAGRVGRPEDVAAAIVYLAGAGFVTGTVLECAGGANLTVGAVAGVAGRRIPRAPVVTGDRRARRMAVVRLSRHLVITATWRPHPVPRRGARRPSPPACTLAHRAGWSRHDGT